MLGKLFLLSTLSHWSSVWMYFRQSFLPICVALTHHSARMHVEEPQSSTFEFFGGTYTAIFVDLLYDRDDASFYVSLCVETFNLETVKADEELFNELVKDVVALSHEFGGLLLCHDTGFVDVWGLEIGEEQNKDTVMLARDLNQVNVSWSTIVRDLMEVSV